MSTDSEGHLDLMERRVQNKYWFLLHAAIRKNVMDAISEWSRMTQSAHYCAKDSLKQLAKRPQERYKRTMKILHSKRVKSERIKAIAAEEWDELCEDTAEWKLEVLRR